jgi:hypothetical protein
MARTRSAGPAQATADLSTMRLDDLRRLGRERGISGTWRMRKDELVRALGGRGGAGGAARGGGAGRGGGARETKARTSAARSTGARETTARTTKARGTKAAGTKAASARAPAGKAREAKAAGGKAAGGKAAPGGGVRRGPSSSRSLRYAQEINSVDDRPDRKGRSLVTRNHDVIMRWAQARAAIPATVPGTEHDGRPGVLRFDFPPHGDNRLQEVSWDEWFRTFDVRGLNFIYQEERRDGGPSNFFILENPDREAG